MHSEDSTPPSRRFAAFLLNRPPYVYVIAVLVAVYVVAVLWRHADQREAIRRVMAVNHSLWQTRDRDMGSGASAAAIAVAGHQYVDALSAIDTRDLPEKLQADYSGYILAWAATAELVEHYSGITGSFKAGYDGDRAVKAKLDACHQQVSDSWERVRDDCRAYGVTVTDDED